MRPRFKRRPRGSVHLVGVSRQLFSWVYLCRFATRDLLTLAVRGKHRVNDRYVARALRKLFDHAYIGKVPVAPFQPDIYCVSGRCVKARDAAVALFGDDARVVHSPSKVRQSELQHALSLAWLRVFAHLSARSRHWDAEFLDHQALTQLGERWPLVPDGAVLLDRRDGPRGRRLVLVEYQRSESARKTTRDKLTQYQAFLPEIERRLGVERAWVLLVMERPDPWVAQLVRELETDGLVGTFFFGTRERVFSMNPDGLWTEPVFYLPGEPGYCSIFKAGKEAATVYEAG